MDNRSLKDRRVLVAGASAGIGRALAVHAVRDGARVLLAARRRDRLEQACREAGGGDPVVADLCRPQDCDRLAAQAGERLGEIDVLVCCIGIAPLRMLADTTGEDWVRVLETNVVGVHRLLRACLPVLAPGGMVMVLSSESIGQPRTGLGAYATSKAALERLVEGWRTERPGVRFTTVRVGATFPTDFGNDFEPRLLERVLDDWSARGLAQRDFMAPGEVAEVLAGVIAASAGHPGIGLDHLTLRSPSPVVGTFDDALGLPSADSAPPADAATPEQGAVHG
ncbi:NADP-dependent 3-hydroxy acid dehydrogenase YdfG [Thermomonospora echinospora]|uniref:NADP-dependent 3-hydroxy acid dehydrogenase YdfG n=1 Tax=Thermomonospora echinospora TaxID=1992 RepID=A0A1H5T2T8_9ACTN|nr:SDR family oxidoreductase [Thermomonospora echinospora]SEF57110.1 NADP-dependent 3-hydroxy acid dehydrogenase YdfG [Thermomonospora echinospora]